MKTVQELMGLVHAEGSDATPLPPIVLVVDDHDDTLELYDALLSAKGYWVARAATGLEALECAQDLRPDAIVTDIGLPGGMDGADLIRELRADRGLSGVPILGVTGRQPGDLPSLAGLDMVALLLKPVAAETLVERVEMALARSTSLNARQPLPQGTGEAPPQAAAEAIPAPERRARVDKKKRTCPSCGERLHWIETAKLHRATFDYYRACDNGCGLFCFDRENNRFEVLLQMTEN